MVNNARNIITSGIFSADVNAHISYVLIDCIKIVGNFPFFKIVPSVVFWHSNSNMTTDCTINRLESGFTTILTLVHYYHQALRCVNQCIYMTKHISNTAFCIVTLTIGGGGSCNVP